MKWIKQRPQLPGWWTLLQVALGVAFFLYMAYGLITSGQTSTPQAATGRDLGHGMSVPGASVPSAGGPAPSAPAAASSSPAATTAGSAPTGGAVTSNGAGSTSGTGSASAAGSGSSGAGQVTPSQPAARGSSAPAGGGTVSLLDVAGNPVPVPAAVADIARRAMLGAFDPTQLRSLPLASGFTPAMPVQTYPHPVAGPLTVVSHSADTFTFTATVDPDGTQRFLTTTQATVVQQNGAWVYTNQAG